MTVVCLPGDGIGPEVMAQAERVLARLGIEHEERLFGGAAILAVGDPLPEETLAACRGADAVLLAAVGLPELEGQAVRPEQGLLRLRQELGAYANLRPAQADGIDLVVVRELVGGLYYGARGVREDGTVFDTLEYRPEQVERVARRAFELAGRRRGRVTSVDKVNVLETSRLWRRVVTEVAADYPGVELDHMLVDTAAMQLVQEPARFDVLLTENTFGDILSDVAAAVTGGLGLAASASIGDTGAGVFEPVHGSAPDIAGRGVANPAAMLRSLALALELALGRDDDARRLEAAVADAMTAAPTPDLGGSATTADFGDAVLATFNSPKGV
jgi:3-isopropylmalate dehydrogenase